MSKVICIMGDSGSGKTTSLRNLDPKETVYIDCDQKGLSWKGWRNDYNKEEHKNYTITSKPASVQSMIDRVNEHEDYTKIKYVVIDTINAIMIDEEMERIKEPKYDKWIDLAESIWLMISKFYKYRDDLTFIVLAHTETYSDEEGYRNTRIKTSGKKLQKLCIESKMTTVLHAKGKNGNYVYETRANDSTCKTPLGAFEEATIPNDIVPVIEVLSEY